MTEITFSEPDSKPQTRTELLPWNFPGAAFGDVIGRENGTNRILMILPAGDQAARFTTISAEALKDPDTTAAFVSALNERMLPEELTGERLVIGPATDLQPNDGTEALTEIVAEPWAPLPDQFDRAVVIIDAGIAFWNTRFRGAQGPRFRGIRYLDFDLPKPPFFDGLDEGEIVRLCDLAISDGSPAVITDLGTRFPNSVFGKTANPNPEGFWHGTAVADLAAGANIGEAENVAMFGLELPRAIVADYSGEMLAGKLAAILPAAVEMTKAFPNLPVTILMPLGFPAGPQDGSHPAAEAIRSFLQTTRRQNLTIVLPAGNHLQDRCHARLDTSGSRNMVCWDLPPDDFSVNGLEIFGKAGETIRLQVAGPGQSIAVDASLPVSGPPLIVEKDRVPIGILTRLVDRGGRSRARFKLWHTALDETRLTPTPCGRWCLFSDGPDPLEFWLLRDDRDPMADRSRPRRPSRFWSAGYVLRDPLGAPPVTDDPEAAVLRSGTLSVLATAVDPKIEVVQATQRYGNGKEVQAAYSGRRNDGKNLTVSELVDDGWPGRGVAAAANGSQRRVRMSGTSAAAGLRARELLGLGPAPLV